MSTEILAEARETYLRALKDPKPTSKELLDFLAEVAEQKPELLMKFEPNPNPGLDALNLEPPWSDKDFSRNMLLAKENFSRQRIEHLIKVREYLRRQEIKGFVPDRSSDNTELKMKSAAIERDYTPPSSLERFVKEGDMLPIRTALRLELNDNSLTAADLRGALVWAKNRVQGLFDSYAEQAFSREMDNSPNSWSSEYYDNQVVYIKTNFSEERFLHLIDVREYLREKRVEGFIPLPPKPKTNTVKDTPVSQSGQQKDSTTQSSSTEHNPVFQRALMIGGALAALAVLLLAITR